MEQPDGLCMEEGKTRSEGVSKFQETEPNDRTTILSDAECGRPFGPIERSGVFQRDRSRKRVLLSVTTIGSLSRTIQRNPGSYVEQEIQNWYRQMIARRHNRI